MKESWSRVDYRPIDVAASELATRLVRPRTCDRERAARELRRRLIPLERFDMRSHERAFVKTVLAKRSNLWLFRTNQRRSCGDFIAIDMSPSRLADRRAYVMELKTGEPTRDRWCTTPVRALP